MVNFNSNFLLKKKFFEILSQKTFSSKNKSYLLKSNTKDNFIPAAIGITLSTKSIATPSVPVYLESITLLQTNFSGDPQIRN